MTADDRAHRLDLPADIELLLAGADAGDSDADAEVIAAGNRIAERLLRATTTGEAAPATVVSLDSRRDVMTVPGWTVRPLAAASETDADTGRTVQRRVGRELGIEFTRSPAGADSTRISVQSFGHRAAAGDLVRVVVGAGDERTELLVVLYVDGEGTLTGQLVTRAVTMSEDLEISLLPGSSLNATHARLITEAVRCSLTPGRNAWRRIAKGVPAGDPVRVAIVDGLS